MCGNTTNVKGTSLEILTIKFGKLTVICGNMCLISMN